MPELFRYLLDAIRRLRRRLQTLTTRGVDEQGGDVYGRQRRDLVRGGPNGELSLSQARQHFRQCGASDPRYVLNVRSPRPEEI